ncbi:hypothetical protein HYT23_01985 [Candidatus Pacearchaeota archaeon]|nr:hypothetical protein [Candidatus Pacearchaeota archaeon]
MVNNKNVKEMEVPFWMIDGFIGVLALVIYNFSLYLLTAVGVGGIIAAMENAMGYFGLNTFLDLGFSASSMTIGLVIVFLFCFCLGVFIGNLVRQKSKYR